MLRKRAANVAAMQPGLPFYVPRTDVPNTPGSLGFTHEKFCEKKTAWEDDLLNLSFLTKNSGARFCAVFQVEDIFIPFSLTSQVDLGCARREHPGLLLVTSSPELQGDAHVPRLGLWEPKWMKQTFSAPKSLLISGLVRYFLDLQEDDFESHVALLVCNRN